MRGKTNCIMPSTKFVKSTALGSRVQALWWGKYGHRVLLLLYIYLRKTKCIAIMMIMKPLNQGVQFEVPKSEVQDLRQTGPKWLQRDNVLNLKTLIYI